VWSEGGVRVADPFIELKDLFINALILAYFKGHKMVIKANASS
jgi:hypothetical protein